MTELVLDAPYAYTTLNKLVERCVKTGIVTLQLAEQIPQRCVERTKPILSTCIHTIYNYTETLPTHSSSSSAGGASGLSAREMEGPSNSPNTDVAFSLTATTGLHGTCNRACILSLGLRPYNTLCTCTLLSLVCVIGEHLRANH